MHHFWKNILTIMIMMSYTVQYYSFIGKVYLTIFGHPHDVCCRYFQRGLMQRSFTILNTIVNKVNMKKSK